MKKIMYIFILFSLLKVWDVFAAWGSCPDSCKISDGPSPWVTEYINNLQSVMSKVRSSLGKTPKNITSINSAGYYRLQKDLVAGYNSIVNWNGYFSTFDYYVTLPMTQSVPYPLKRDHELIQTQIKRLNTLMETVIRRGADFTPVKWACDGLQNVKCELNDLPAKQIVVELTKNTEKLADLMRLSIIGQPENFVWDFFLVKPNFRDEISIYYNKYTAEACARCEPAELNAWSTGNFINTFSYEKQMTSIFDYNRLWKNGIQRWKDAWALLNGNAGDAKYRMLERQLLSRELWRQWLSGDQSAVILRNLDKYNDAGYSLSNNFLVNTFNDPLWKRLEKMVYDFNDAVQKAKDKYGAQPIPFVEIASISQSVKNWSFIKKEIDAYYDSEVPFAQVIDDAAWGLLAKIVSYHVSLSQVISGLDTVIPISVNVCNSQCNNKNVICNYAANAQ